MKKRILVALLAYLLTMQAVSCAKSETAESTDEANVPATAEEAETDAPEPEPAELSRENTPDNLPESMDFEGAQITFILRPENLLFDGTGDNSGDVVFESVYNRNLAVEERLNVDLNYIATQDNDFSAMASLVSNSITAGIDEYSVVLQRGLQMFQHAREGLYQNLIDAPYIEREQPWWWMDTINETLPRPDTYIPYILGDMSLSTFNFCTACFFNKNMITDIGFNVDELYQTVSDGKWTYDVFSTYCQDAYRDVNGNGERDVDDIMPATTVSYGASWLNSSAGIRYTERNSDGQLELLYDQNEALVGYIDKIIEVIHTNKYIDMTETDYTKVFFKFMEDESLFFMGRFTYTNNLRDMESSYGLIPYPKYSEDLPYMSGTGQSGNFIAVPTTNQTNFEATCAALEAINAESYRYVFPALFESAMKIKYANTDKDAQMVDIIHDSIYIDFTAVAGLDVAVEAVVNSGVNTFASSSASQKKMLDKQLEKILEDMQ